MTFRAWRLDRISKCVGVDVEEVGGGDGEPTETKKQPSGQGGGAK